MSDIISIIIPTFNRRNQLSNAINSVRNQTCGDWELVIIDDGSTDETEELLNNYKADIRIKSYYQNNQGVSVARNFGVQKATGKYIIFLDSDDIFYPDLIQTLFDVNYTKYDILCWEVQKIIDGKKILWKAKKLGGMYNYLEVTFFPGSICYRKQIFLDAGGFDPKIHFGENYELGIRISEQGKLKVKLIQRTFLLYVINSSNRESISWENRIPSHLHQLKKHLGRYNQNLKEKSELLYIIGFQIERSGLHRKALPFYQMAFKNHPFRIKTILKILQLLFSK